MNFRHQIKETMLCLARSTIFPLLPWSFVLSIPFINRSRDVAQNMNKGVDFLMKKNKIDVFIGEGLIGKSKKVKTKIIGLQFKS